MQLLVKFSLHNIITFLEFLHQSSLSPKVISNYLSSIISMAKFYYIEHSALSHIAMSRFLRSITINSGFSPTPRVFLISTPYTGFPWLVTLYLIQFYFDLFFSLHFLHFRECPMWLLIVPELLTLHAIFLGKTSFLLILVLTCLLSGPRPSKASTHII